MEKDLKNYQETKNIFEKLSSELEILKETRNQNYYEESEFA